MWKPLEILMILELFLDQILWRARNKWKFLTFYLKCAISKKNIESIENLNDGFLIAILPNILQKEKMKSD